MDSFLLNGCCEQLCLLVETQNTTVCQNVDSSNLLLFHSKRNEEVCGAFNKMIFSQNMLHLKKEMFLGSGFKVKMGSQCKLLFKSQASLSSVSAEKLFSKPSRCFHFQNLLTVYHFDAKQFWVQVWIKVGLVRNLALNWHKMFEKEVVE